MNTQVWSPLGWTGWLSLQFKYGEINKLLSFLSGSAVKNLTAMQETQEMRVWSLGWEDPLEEDMQPTPVFLPGESLGQKRLVGYGTQGLK